MNDRSTKYGVYDASMGYTMLLRRCAGVTFWIQIHFWTYDMLCERAANLVSGITSTARECRGRMHEAPIAHQ